MTDEPRATPVTVADLPVSPGLCATCRHALVKPTHRGTVYLRCTAPELPKYPDLPVHVCSGHEPGSAPGSGR